MQPSLKNNRKIILTNWLASLVLLTAFCLTTFLTSCAGKTAVLEGQTKPIFIPKNRRTIFIAYPINFTQHFGLDQTIRNGVTDYFKDTSTPFTITDQIDEATSYMTIKIYAYQFGSSLVRFHNANAVNRYYRAKLEVSLQDPPTDFISFSLTGDNPKGIITYLESQPIILRKYYFLDLQDPLQSKEILEKKFLTELGKNIEYLLRNGMPKQEI